MNPPLSMPGLYPGPISQLCPGRASCSGAEPKARQKRPRAPKKNCCPDHQAQMPGTHSPPPNTSKFCCRASQQTAQSPTAVASRNSAHGLRLLEAQAMQTARPQRRSVLPPPKPPPKLPPRAAKTVASALPRRLLLQPTTSSLAEVPHCRERAGLLQPAL